MVDVVVFFIVLTWRWDVNWMKDVMWMRDVISFSMMLNVVGGCHNAIANTANSPFLHLMITEKNWVEGMLVLLLCYYHPVELQHLMCKKGPGVKKGV